MLALPEQIVRWYWYMFEFECVIAWYKMHYHAIAIAHSPAIEIHYNGNDIQLCANVDAIYGMVSCWFWTNRRYVSIGACLNLNVLILGI